MFVEELLYENKLQQASDLRDWISEGEINIQFDEGVILENKLSDDMGDYAHWTYWIPNDFPTNIKIEWEFKPLREPGLCMIFFSAIGINGESIFSEKLNNRTGYYPQYHHGDINTYHISYFRHKYASELAFRTCNLRKSYGFHFEAQGADPLPSVGDAEGFYQLKLVKFQNEIKFYINGLKILDWEDDGKNGVPLENGKIGFRQMAPMKAEYKNLKIFSLKKRG